jgi:hypothetical protein
LEAASAKRCQVAVEIVSGEYRSRDAAGLEVLEPGGERDVCFRALWSQFDPACALVHELAVTHDLHAEYVAIEAHSALLVTDGY